MKSLSLGHKDRWDIGIDEDGNFLFLTKAEQVAQFLRNRLLFIFKEWRYNQYIGVPYYEHILVNSPNLGLIESIFKKEILETKEVEELQEFELTLRNLNLNVYFSATSIFGRFEVII